MESAPVHLVKRTAVLYRGRTMPPPGMTGELMPGKIMTGPVIAALGVSMTGVFMTFFNKGEAWV